MFSLQMWGMVLVTMIWTSLHTLLGTNISPTKSVLKMIFIFPKRDMLRIVPWRVAGSVCGIVTSQFWYHLLDPEVSPARPGLAARSNSKSLRDYGSVRHGELWLLGSTKKGGREHFPSRGIGEGSRFPWKFFRKRCLETTRKKNIARQQLQAGIFMVVGVICMYTYIYTNIYTSLYNSICMWALIL